MNTRTVSWRNKFPAHWKDSGPDLAGGVTTAIVSLPMALAFGVASGVGPQAGLYGAVCVGLFAALFGGSSRLISEPTGPMTVIMTSVLVGLCAKYPEQGLAMSFTVVMAAGLFQILIGAFRLGKFITLMPYSVISGFMSGIGVILIILQLPPALGHPAPAGGVVAVLKGLPGIVSQLQLHEVLLAATALLVLWRFPSAWRKHCPPQLFVLVVGTVLSISLFSDTEWRRIGPIPMGLPTMYWPIFNSEMAVQILLDGMVLGTLGALDTLLTAMVADSLTRESHDSDRELVGQGIGNIISGLCGGLPGAGATMGTVVNIQTGAKTVLAGVIRALLLLVVVLWAAPLVAPIPMALLAAIAIMVGVRILDWSFMKRAHRVSMTSTCIMYGVLLLTVLVDLIVAVGVGVFIANLLTIQRLSSQQEAGIKTVSVPNDDLNLNASEKALLARTDGRVLLFHLSGPMIFGVAKAIAREHAQMERVRVLIIDLADVPYMGMTVALGLENMVLDAVEHGARVYLVGAAGITRERLARLDLLSHPGLAELSDRPQAIKTALEELAQCEAAPKEGTA